jgi:hypothetical protein
MTTFKIRDLMISLEPGWCGATPECGPNDVPTAADRYHIDLCRVSSPGCDRIRLLCIASNLVANLDCVPANELAVLRSQLTEALNVIHERQNELQDSRSLEPKDPAEVAALKIKLSEALAELNKQ